MRYPPEFIDRVQESSSLVDVISQYTQLKPSGGGFMGRCPFPDHQEKTASFSVSDAKQVYHCFGCKKSGNIFTFLRDYNGMNFPEALEYLADRNGVPIPETSVDQNDQHAVQQNKKKQMLKINRVASDFFRETLKRAPVDSAIKRYVQSRKLSPETIEAFGIGFASSEWDALTLHLHKQNFSAGLAEEARLIKARKEGHGHFDLFRDRLMFPILSASGDVLAFGGRIHDEGEPKYLNSPETLVFHKSRVLYGLSQTAKYIRAEDVVVIVEGYMDLVSLFQSGLKNVAASMGTALTSDQARLIKRMTNNVVVLFDGDEAGRVAAERSLPILLGQGLYPKGLVLTEAKDPDEFIHKFGLAAMNEKIQKSSDLFNVVLQSWMHDYQGEASQKVKLVDRLKPIFEAVTDARLKSLYAEDLANKMKVTKEWLRASLFQSSSLSANALRQPHAFGSSDRPKPVSAPTDSAAKGEISTEQPRLEGGTPKIKLADASSVEISLLQMTLKSRANFEWLIRPGEAFVDGGTKHDFKQILSQINHLGVRQILEKAEQVYRQDVLKFDKFFAWLIENIDKPELLFANSSFGVVAQSPTTLEFDADKEQKFLSDIALKIHQNYIRAQSKRMTLDIKQGSDVEKLNEFMKLHKDRLSLKK